MDATIHSFSIIVNVSGGTSFGATTCGILQYSWRRMRTASSRFCSATRSVRMYSSARCASVSSDDVFDAASLASEAPRAPAKLS